MPNHKVQLLNLEKRVKALSSALVYLGNLREFKELILIIKRPGWTTPAEYLFVSAIVDSMITQATALTKLKGALLKGSKAVNTKG